MNEKWIDELNINIYLSFPFYCLIVGGINNINYFFLFINSLLIFTIMFTLIHNIFKIIYLKIFYSSINND